MSLYNVARIYALCFDRINILSEKAICQIEQSGMDIGGI